jgi:hypothetical protein
VVIEAKSSAPQPAPPARFDEFIGEIRNKLVNALSLGIAACLARHPAAQAELPDRFRALDLGTSGFRLVLVINGFQKAWLPPLQDALSKALASTRKLWALGPNAVAVLNDVGAREHGLLDLAAAQPIVGGNPGEPCA